MAKLSARGRTELARLTRDRSITDELINRERITLAFMSDGNILRKRDVWFRSDGRYHSYGWKVLKRLHAHDDIDGAIADYEKKGFTRES